MRTPAFALAAACAFAALPAFPQAARESSTVIYDVNGHRLDWASSSAAPGRSAETSRNINGRRVPVEQVEEKLVSDQGGTRVVERTIRRYDSDGRPLPAEKSVIQTTLRPDGSGSESVATYRADLNGRLQVAERTDSRFTKSGDTVSRQTTVERSTLNGGLEPVERRVATETATKTSASRDETVYRLDANGRFSEAARQVVRTDTVNGETREQVDDYSSGSTGRLQLSKQAVSRTVKTAEGAERREVDVYTLTAAGRTASDDAKLQLRERQVYTTRQSADGTTVQVFAVQQPVLGSANQFGPLQVFSETVSRPVRDARQKP